MKKHFLNNVWIRKMNILLAPFTHSMMKVWPPAKWSKWSRGLEVEGLERSLYYILPLEPLQLLHFNSIFSFEIIFFAKFLTRLLYNDGIIPHWIKIIRMLLFLFCSLRRKKEAEDRKKIQLFKEFLNNIQSEYAMIYLTLICLNLNFTFWVKIYVLMKSDQRLPFKRKIGHSRRMPLFETGIQTVFR